MPCAVLDEDAGHAGIDLACLNFISTITRRRIMTDEELIAALREALHAEPEQTARLAGILHEHDTPKEEK